MRAALRSWKSLGIVTFSTVTSAVLTLVVTLVAVAFLSKAEFGHFIFFVAIVTLVGAFFDFGVSFQMMMEHGTEPPAAHDALVTRCWSAQLWSYAGGAALVVILAAPVASYFHVPMPIVALGGLTGAVVGLFNFVTSLLQSREQWTRRAHVIVRYALLRATGSLVGLAFGSASSAALGTVIGTVIGFLIALRAPELVVLRSATRTLNGLPDAWRTWIRSRWFVVFVVAVSAAEYAPIAFVSRTAGAEPLASFGLAAQLAAGPGLVLTAINTFLMPSASNPTVPLREYARLIKRSVVPAFILFAIAALAAPFLIPTVFGRDFAGAVVPFELLLVATAIFVAANPLQSLYFRLRDARGWALIDAVRLATLVAGLLVLSRFWSAPVAAGGAFAISALVSRILGFVGLARQRDVLTGRV